MALVTTETYFPIILKSKDARQVAPLTPNVLLLRCVVGTNPVRPNTLPLAIW
jgi:hypothetical protein